MRHVLTLCAIVVSVTLTLASAQTTVQLKPPLPAKANTSHLPSGLVKPMRSGTVITLQDAQEHVVDTVNRDSTVKQTIGMVVSRAMNIKQVLPNGTADLG